MSYSLRPEAKLKRPPRYRETDDGEFSYSREPKSGNRDTATDLDGFSLSDTLTANPSPPEPSSFTTDAPRLSQNPPPEMNMSGVPRSAIPNTSDPPNPPKSRKMANVKYVKKRSRDEEQHEDKRKDTPPGSKRARRSNKVAQRAATPPDEPSPALSAPRPSTFPSLSGNAPPLLPATVGFTKYGLRELMEAIDNDDDERVKKIKRQFADEYEVGTGFWYEDLRNSWPPKMEEPTMAFENLWPSLRQTIIERIQDEFTPGAYFSSFYPVRRLLNITKEKLDEIMVENAKIWADDEIPHYFKEYRKRYPKAVIDPDEPPPPCVVAAIIFLKQHSLPGSLLGEWQKLPAVEVFRNPYMFYLPTKKGSVESPAGYIAKSIEPVGLACIPHQSIREHPDVLSPNEALEVTWRIEQDAIKQANRKQQDANKQSQLPCRICGRKGRMWLDLDENGVHKCPQRLKEVVQHRTELETLRAQVSAEIEAITQRDLAMKSAPPNSTQSVVSGPIDATPYLEAWQANRANPNIRFHLHQPAGPPEDGRTKYINQLQRDNETNPMWKRNHFLNRRLGHAAMSTSDASGRPTNPTNQPPMPQTALTSANPPLWPNTPYLTQQQGQSLQQSATPHMPKKRGPYKKKDKKEGPNSTPPPNRVVGRDGMIFLSSSRQAQDVIEAQRRDEGEGATVGTGLVTPPLQTPPLQQKEQLLPTASTCKAGAVSVVERHAGADAKVEATQQPLVPPATPVSEAIAVSAMGSEVGVNGNGASAAILPPYPYQASPTQKPGRVPLFKEMEAGEEQG